METGSDNIMSLIKLVLPYKQKKDSGLLTIKVEGYENLLKIYFELGMVAGLSIGTLKNEDCFNMLGKCRPIGATFMKGYKAPDLVAADKKEINNKFDQLIASYPITGGTSTGTGASKVVHVRADDLLKLENDVINIMGPVGKMILETLYAELGYTRGVDMPSPMYSQLLDKIKGELPSQHQPTFAAKYAIGLALSNSDV